MCTDTDTDLILVIGTCVAASDVVGMHNWAMEESVISKPENESCVHKTLEFRNIPEQSMKAFFTYLKHIKAFFAYLKP